MAIITELKKTIYYIQRNGMKMAAYAVAERMHRKGEVYRYAEPTKEELGSQRRKYQELTEQVAKSKEAYLPLISILVPAYETGELYLRQLISSVLAQTYENWELIIADASAHEGVAKVLREYADSRIKYRKLGANDGISENSNRGLSMVAGDYVGLLDHDDLLTPDALFCMYQGIVAGKKDGVEVEMIYSDEDKCDSEGYHFYDPNIKEDFNLDLLLSNNYICHFLILKKELIKKLGFRREFDGAQDYDLILRAVRKIMTSSQGEKKIVHIGRVLYHWRCHSGSTAENPKSKTYAYEAGKRALQAFADKEGMKARAVDLPHLGFYRLNYEEDPFFSRKDLGAIGGKLLHKNKIVGGRMDETGKVFYEKLPAVYSGPLHRAVLTQDALAVDLRLIRIPESCYGLFEEILGIPYKAEVYSGCFDISTLPKDADIKEWSLKLCKGLREKGYRILWDPEWITEI